MHSRLRPIVIIGWISLALGGCASTKESVLPQDGPSMKAIYDAHFEGMGADDPYVLRRELGTRPLGDDDVDLAGYSRSAHTELENWTRHLLLFRGQQIGDVPCRSSGDRQHVKLELPHALRARVATSTRLSTIRCGQTNSLPLWSRAPGVPRATLSQCG